MNRVARVVRFAARLASALAATRRVGFVSGPSGREIVSVLGRLLTAKALVQGRAIDAYERDWQRFLPVAHAVSFGSGRLCLYAILRGLGVGSGDEVIVPGYTCVVVPNAVLYAGARPVFADIEPHSLNVDIRAIESKMTQSTKAFILSHNFGVPGDVGGALKLAERYGVAMIEDCAHALGAKYRGRRIGTFGTAGFFSTEQSKVISTVRGGMAVTNNDALGAFLRDFQHECRWPRKGEVRNFLIQHLVTRAFAHPRAFALGNMTRELLTRWEVIREATGPEELVSLRPRDYATRLANAQAALGRIQLARVDQANARRRENARMLARVCESAGVTPVEVPADSEATLLRFPVWVANKAWALQPETGRRVEIGRWFESVTHPAAASPEAVGYRRGECPIGEQAARGVINLPTQRRLGPNEIEDVHRILLKAGAR